MGGGVAATLVLLRLALLGAGSEHRARTRAPPPTAGPSTPSAPATDRLAAFGRALGQREGDVTILEANQPHIAFERVLQPRCRVFWRRARPGLRSASGGGTDRLRRRRRQGLRPRGRERGAWTSCRTERPGPEAEPSGRVPALSTLLDGRATLFRGRQLGHA
jgi:hypothetical protein